MYGELLAPGGVAGAVVVALRCSGCCERVPGDEPCEGCMGCADKELGRKVLTTAAALCLLDMVVEASKGGVANLSSVYHVCVRRARLG